MRLGAAAAPIDHPCVIVDIDGTILDCKHRVHHLQKHPKDWDSFFAEMDKDVPFPMIVELVKILRQHYAIVLCTGREEKLRERTQEQLRLHDVWHDGLFMRPANDRRDDHIVKAELLEEIRGCGFKPIMAIEDRARVCAMWRAKGLTCLQVDEGNF